MIQVKLLIYTCLLLTLLSCTQEEIPNTTSLFPEYKLLFSYSPEYDYFTKQNLINYFKMVALGSEYGNSLPISRKWISTMKIFVGGHPSDELLTELNFIIEEINGLVTDNFLIEIVEESEKANFYIFFGGKDEYATKFPGQASYVSNNKGLFSISWNSEFEIISGHMYVDIENTYSAEQKHILREELTQSLGLPNDIPYYPNSIFYKDWSLTYNYSNLDIEVIRLLYHPMMRSGLNAVNIEFLLKAILGIR